MYENLRAQVVSPDNATRAWLAVQRNGGAPGMDGMTTEALREHIRKHWESLRTKLLAGTYAPSPVRRVEIPKPHGGTRLLGIPTVLDRWLQQRLLQVLQAILDPLLSLHSYGFRPGRRAHDAVRASPTFVQGGQSWVVDMDITKFFDHVNHDLLMHWIGQHLRLEVNASKSGAGRPWERKFLGFRISPQGQIEVAPPSIEKFRHKVRELWRSGQSLTSVELRDRWRAYVRGWWASFRLAEDRRNVLGLEGWIRRHMRTCFWLRWHDWKGRLRHLRSLGLRGRRLKVAHSSTGAWRIAASPSLQSALCNAVLRRYGFVLPSDLTAAT